MDTIERIARATLYEGYLLWPYRRSAIKNRQRWTFGGVFPRTFSESGHEDDAWMMRTECLLEMQPGARLEVEVRFLQVTHRQCVATAPDGDRAVDCLAVGGEEYLTWDEATERSISVPALAPGDGNATAESAIAIPADSSAELLEDEEGTPAGRLVRSWNAITGTVTAGLLRVADGVARVRVEITNTTAFHGTDRADAVRHALISAHTILRASGAQLVSATDPPEQLQELAAACRNIGTWPVLVGRPGERHLMLSSPIILSDYPEIAPESPGDLFDGGEIDQLLILNVLSLTDDEKREMRATDPRAREILDRCAALSPEELGKLSGRLRETVAGHA